MPRLRTKKTKFVLRKQIVYSIFCALFIAIGYIAAQAQKVQNFYYAIRRSLFKCSESYRTTKLKDL